jgi:glucose dehydrogenase (acceptor)
MIYNRGNRRDYDRWAENGLYGWSWNDVLPYFKKSEHATMEDLQDSPNHGKNGPANIEYNRHRTILANAFIEANEFMGLKQIDYNSGDQLGVSYLQSNNLQGQRQTSFRAFIDPILDRPNLHIMVNTRATKVLIDPETKSAYGVQYVRNRKIYTVRAKKEVILSAGCFNSPQLLMLSGIGPREELARIGVPLIQDLPVGKQLFEHVAIMGITFLVNTTRVSPNVERDLNIGEIANWLNGQGKFVLAGGVEALAFLKTKEGRGPEVPDVELLFIPGSLHSDQGSGIRKALRMPDETYNTVYKPLEKRIEDTFMIMPMQFHPKSIGYVKLKDSNPFHWPILNPKFFSDPEDVETMLDGIRYIMKLVQTPPFEKFGARLHDIPLPGCAHIHFASDDYWRMKNQSEILENS